MKKADIILIAIVFAVVGVILFFLYGVNTNSGSYVTVEINGEITETLSLNENKTLEISTENDGTNTLEIKDGVAKMTSANCPDGICTNHKAINRAGESIICLPHKVVITVVNEKESDDDIDAVA